MTWPVGAAATATRTSCCEEPRRHTRASLTSPTESLARHIVVGTAVKDALAMKVGTADKPRVLKFTAAAG